MQETNERCTRCMVVKMIIIAVAIFFFASMGYQYYNQPPAEVSETLATTSSDLSHLPTFVATIVPSPRLVHPFNLTDDANKTFTADNFQQHWSVLFFGFTSCDMMCPTTMAELGKFYQLLKDQKVKTMPEVVMISVDPEHDTTAAMHKYVKSFNSNFVGVTGNEKEVEKLTAELGIVYMKAAKTTDEMAGQINHSGTLVLINPKGEAQAFFSYPHDAKQIASDYKTIVEHAAS